MFTAPGRTAAPKDPDPDLSPAGLGPRGGEVCGSESRRCDIRPAGRTAGQPGFLQRADAAGALRVPRCCRAVTAARIAKPIAVETGSGAISISAARTTTIRSITHKGPNSQLVIATDSATMPSTDPVNACRKLGSVKP